MVTEWVTPAMLVAGLLIWWFTRPGGQVQPSCAWCPRCQAEMMSGSVEKQSWTTVIEQDDGATALVCWNCGNSSVWDLGAPAPLLLRDQSQEGVMRVTEEKKRSVMCPVCRAKPGNQCSYYRASTRSVTLGVMDRAHDARRLAYLRQQERAS